MGESAAERAARITKDLWRADNYNTGEETDAALLAVEIRAAEHAARRAVFKEAAGWCQGKKQDARAAYDNRVRLSGKQEAQYHDGKRTAYRASERHFRALAAEVKDG